MSAEHPAWVSLSTSARRTVAVPGAMAVSAFFYVLVTWVVAGVWEAAAEGTGTLAGYTAAALVWYIAASEGVTIPLNSRLISELGGAITDGTVATELLRPVSVVWQRVAVEIGRVLPRLAMCAGIGLVLATVLAGAPPSPAALALAAPSMVLAVAVNIVAQHAFSAAAFWLRETGATWFLYQKLVFLTGGMLIPLEVLPGWLRAVALATPFPSMAYAPARLASGHVEPGLLLMQVGWLCVLSIVCALMFARGERHLEVSGG